MTPDTLRAATGCTAERAALFAGPLSEACAAYGINTPERLAAFLAQIGHESGSLRYVREIASGAAYEGRKDLGNTDPGDGQRYRGRGLIQITGRYNYRRTTDRLHTKFGPSVPDFEDDPEALEQPRWAALSAADYWDAHILNLHADKGDFTTITRAINGGLNGQADRLARWERAKAALSAAPAENNAPPSMKSTATEASMPLPAIVGALLPSLIESIPKLGKLFGSGSEVAERNVKAAELAVSIAQDAIGATNAQEAVEKAKSDPAAAQAITQAIEARWLELTEAGGDGIAGARKADEAARAAGPWVWLQSPSLWIAVLMLPLVYILVLSLVGLIGTATWSDDVRAGLAGSLISAIVGGLIGYYYGQTTTKNRTAAP